MTVFIVFVHASSRSQFAMTCKCASHNYGTNLCRGFSFCVIRHRNAGSFWNFQYSCTFVNSKWSASRFISFFVFFLRIPVCDVCFLWSPASVPRETKVVLGQNRVHHPSKPLVLYRRASRGVPREAPSLSTFVSTSATGPTFSVPFVMNTPGMNTQLKYLSKKKKKRIRTKDCVPHADHVPRNSLPHQEICPHKGFIVARNFFTIM